MPHIYLYILTIRICSVIHHKRPVKLGSSPQRWTLQHLRDISRMGHVAWVGAMVTTPFCDKASKTHHYGKSCGRDPVRLGDPAIPPGRVLQHVCRYVRRLDPGLLLDRPWLTKLLTTTVPETRER